MSARMGPPRTLPADKTIGGLLANRCAFLSYDDRMNGKGTGALGVLKWLGYVPES